MSSLSGSTADEEPLVDGAIDGSRGKLLVGGERRKLVRGNTAAGVLDSNVGSGNTAGGSLAGDETLPGLVALTDDVHGVPIVMLLAGVACSCGDKLAKNSLLVLALAGESELVLGLAVRDLVDAEPLVGGTDEAGEVTLNILNVVELGGKRVVDVNDNDLPVGLLLVEKGHDTEDLDLLDLAGVADELADLADVERVIVTLGLGLGVDGVGVLPGLGEGTVVPEVALVGEAVADEAKLALLGVLLDGVQELLLGDLWGSC